VSERFRDVVADLAGRPVADRRGIWDATLLFIVDEADRRAIVQAVADVDPDGPRARSALNTAAAPGEPGRLTVPLHERLTWSLADVEAVTGIPRRTLERLRSAGKLPPPHLRIGRRLYWLPSTIRGWIEGGGR
jgi:hypothetical protein